MIVARRLLPFVFVLLVAASVPVALSRGEEWAAVLFGVATVVALVLAVRAARRGPRQP